MSVVVLMLEGRVREMPRRGMAGWSWDIVRVCVLGEGVLFGWEFGVEVVGKAVL